MATVDLHEQRSRLAAEAAAHEKALTDLAEVDRQIAAEAAAQRAAQFDQVVAEVDRLATAAEAARAAFMAGLDNTLFPSQQTPESIAALVDGYRRAIRTAQQHESAAKSARAEAESHIDADAAAYPPEERAGYIESQRAARFKRIRRAQSVSEPLEKWFDAASPGGAEAYLKTVLLAQVIDRRWLDQWQLSLEDRRLQRQRARLGGHNPLMAR